MTITTQDLIDAARAIGIEVNNGWIGSTPCLLYRDQIWNPEHDKSQLMDLQFKLKLDVYWDDENGGVVVGINNTSLYEFDNTTKSFASAIILPAAEIGRGIK